ncbi:RING finger protein 32 isoform X2 [Silurus meridionalis]|uniref:RING-type domain-containing protein n=2 Tax=Silurus meridionalis TaxID=175797 RepID=A0A8T0BFL3_SILME|nr:RING finger protein 32 isoform X2 [Silurus meridionalis]KAF7705951.1 hypothetical protein HF521_019205 [Silurus meridionalis]
MMAGLLQDRIVRRISQTQHSVTPSPSTRSAHTHTLAQRTNEQELTRGLCQPPPKPAQGLVATPSSRRRLSADEWMQVNGNCARPCVICNEEFRLQPQACLRKCQLSSGRKFCPQCRTAQYETRVIYDGVRLYREKCALRIQAWWRGCVTRRWYRDMRKIVPTNGLQFHCRFFAEKELKENMLQTLHIDLDTFLQDMDVNIAHFRHVMQQFSCHIGTFRDMEDEWSETQEKALRRDTHDCPICLSPLRSAEVVLLSCSHLLHQSCLRESELACQDRDATCPLCRSQYVSVPVPDSALLAYHTRYGS